MGGRLFSQRPSCPLVPGSFDIKDSRLTRRTNGVCVMGLGA